MATDELPPGDDGAVLDYGHRDATPIDGSKLVRLGPFADLVELSLMKASLEEHAIEVHTAGENQAAALGAIYGRAYGGPYLLVHAVDEEAARRVIAGIEQRRRDRMNREAPECPRCHEYASVRVIPMTRWLGFFMVSGIVLVPAMDIPFAVPIGALVSIAGLYLMLRPMLPTWNCRACKHGYQAPAPDPLED